MSWIGGRLSYFKSNSSECGASRVILGSEEAIFEGSCMSTDQSACVSGSSSLKSCPSTESDSDLSEIEVSTLAYSVAGVLSWCVLIRVEFPTGVTQYGPNSVLRSNYFAESLNSSFSLFLTLSCKIPDS